MPRSRLGLGHCCKPHLRKKSLAPHASSLVLTMPGESKWANLFPEFGAVEIDESHSVYEDRTSGADIVAVVDDDAASSVCLDDLDANVELEDAIKVAKDLSEKEHLTDYDIYTQEVAKNFIARERVVRRRTLAVPDRPRYGYVELLEKTDEESKSGPEESSTYKGSIFDEGDIESLATLDIDTIDDPFVSAPSSGVRRQIRPRDFHLITLGGYIGLAFFQDVAKSLYLCGPVFVFMTFSLSCLMFYSMMGAVAEMVAFVPHDAGYTGIISTVVDKSFAAAFGISYWFQACFRVPYEVILTVSLFSVFPILNQPDYSSLVWLTFVLMMVIGINFVYVRVWGRLNALTALVSLALIVVLNIYNLLLNTGHIGPLYNHIGAKYWDYGKMDGINYGPFKPYYGERKIGGSMGGLLAFWLAWVTSAFGFTGLDVVFVPTAEIRNPRRTVSRTMKVLPWRLGVVFTLTLFIVLFVVNSGDPILKTAGGVETAEVDSLSASCGIAKSRWKAFNGIIVQSAWVVAFLEQRVCYATFAAVAFFIYIGYLAAAGHLFVGSRTVYGLSQLGIIWKRIGVTSRNGVPYVAVMLSSVFALTVYVIAGAKAVSYYLFLSRWVVGSLWMVWAILCFTYYRFYRVIQASPNIDRYSDDYPYRAPFQPYASIVCGSICLFFALFSAVPDFLSREGFSVEAFLGFYCPVALFCLVFAVHKWVYKTSFIKIEDVNLDVFKSLMDRQEWEEDRVYSKSFRGALWQSHFKLKSHWNREAKPLLRRKFHAKET